jgi:hypothetical protein
VKTHRTAMCIVESRLILEQIVADATPLNYRRGREPREALYLLAIASGVPRPHRTQPQGLTHEDVAINLDRGDQFKPEYRAQNLSVASQNLTRGSSLLAATCPARNDFGLK